MQVKSIAECSPLLQGEHSAILSTFIHLLFVIKIFVLSFFEWPLKTGFAVLTTYMYFLFCGIRRLSERWIFLLNWDFFTTKKDGSTWPTALESDGPYFEIMGQWPGPTINLKACRHFGSVLVIMPEFVHWNEWWMVVSEVGALMKKFCMAEIWTWGNDGSKKILRLMGGRGGGTRSYL